MNKLKRKAVYEAPVTERFSVELEGSFCGSVEMDPDKDNKVSAGDHEINQGFNGGNEFVGGTWE